MSIGRHITKKKPGDSTYSPQWSGVSYAPHCKNKCKCPNCYTLLHKESGEHYCPYCDNFVQGWKPNGFRCSN